MKKIIYPILILVLAGLAVFFIMPRKKAPVPISTALATPMPEKTNPVPAKFQVPILMYHYIRVADSSDKLGLALSVTPDNFNQQMQWLSDNNYTTIKLADLADPEKKELSRTIAENKKPVIISFDDGYDDAYTNAFPALKKHGFIGTFFIIRHFVSQPRYATQPQIDEMVADDMEIGSHTMDHRDLSRLVLATAKTQIFDSKQGSSTFCYPSGRFNDQVIPLVEEAGYVAAVTTQSGIANEKSDLFRLPRVRITNINIEDFAKRVNGTN